MVLAIVNGPNLNCLAYRARTLYGGVPMEDILHTLRATYSQEAHLVYFQSNEEGEIINFLQYNGLPTANGKFFAEQPSGIILNAGGYTHSSVSLRDCVAMLRVPVVEVHISNIHAREAFRQSLLTDVCAHSIVGEGVEGYARAVEWLLKNRPNEENTHIHDAVAHHLVGKSARNTSDAEDAICR